MSICGDIRSRAIREQIDFLAATADVVVGGPPCQAFSQVRNHSRLIDDPRNSLYREFVRVVRTVLPNAFVMENVTGIDQMGIREQIISDLSLDGEYHVIAQILDAANFGVPQTRKRLLFVGIRSTLRCGPPKLRGSDAIDSIALVRTPERKRARYDVVVQESVFSKGMYEALRDPNDLSVVTVEQALSDLVSLQIGNRVDDILWTHLPTPQSAYQRLMRDGMDPRIANVQVPRINEDTAIRLEAIPPGGNYRDLSPKLMDRYLTGQRWGQDNGSGRLSRRHFYAYRRLHPGIWAWTLNTKADSVYHYERSRALSVREFARLQSFPDRFVFTTDARRGAIRGRQEGGAAHSRYRQVGNAVPPLLGKALGEALEKVLVTALARNLSRAA